MSVEVQVEVSDRERALVIVWNRMVDAWDANDCEEARFQEILYTRVEMMTDRDFEEGYKYN